MEGRGVFKEISSVFALPPWHPIRTSAAAPGDEARLCLFGAKKGYLRRMKVLSRDLSLWRRIGRKELMSGRKREGVLAQKKKTEVMKKTGCIWGRGGEWKDKFSEHFQLEKGMRSHSDRWVAGRRIDCGLKCRLSFLFIYDHLLSHDQTEQTPSAEEDHEREFLFTRMTSYSSVVHRGTYSTPGNTRSSLFPPFSVLWPLISFDGAVSVIQLESAV